MIDNEILVPQLHFVTQRVQTLITSCHSLLMKQLLHRTQILPTWNASEIKHMFDVLHKFSAVMFIEYYLAVPSSALIECVFICSDGANRETQQRDR